MKMRLAMCAAAAALAAPAAAQVPPKPLFASTAPLPLTIEAPFGGFLRNRGSEKPVDAFE